VFADSCTAALASQNSHRAQRRLDWLVEQSVNAGDMRKGEEEQGIC
jgi:hypothetical protein